jgi:hypothetical protein
MAISLLQGKGTNIFPLSKKIAVELITWIFFIFLLCKFRVISTDVVASLFPPQCQLSSDWHHHTATSCHAFFPLSQNKLATSTLSFDNASFHRLPFWVETKALNLYHRYQPPSSDCPTPTLQCYKNIISTLVTLPTLTVSPFCLFPSHNRMSLELHPPSLFSFTAVPHSSSLHIMTPTVTN